MGQGQGFEFALVNPGRYLGFAPDLAIDLQHHLDLAAHHGAFVRLGPGGVDHRLLVAQAVPQLMADVRDDRGQHQHRRVQRFLSQPFHVAEQFTGIPGVLVSIEDTIKGFNMILNGELDQYPEAAFNLKGNIEEVIEAGEKMLAEA